MRTPVARALHLAGKTIQFLLHHRDVAGQGLSTMRAPGPA